MYATDLFATLAAFCVCAAVFFFVLFIVALFDIRSLIKENNALAAVAEEHRKARRSLKDQLDKTLCKLYQSQSEIEHLESIERKYRTSQYFLEYFHRTLKGYEEGSEYHSTEVILAEMAKYFQSFNGEEIPVEKFRELLKF